MENPNSANIRSQIANFQLLISSRNLAEIEKRSKQLVAQLEKSEKEDAPRLLAFVKGISLHSSNRYKEAQPYFLECISLSEYDPEMRGLGHMGFGFTQRSLGNLDDSVSHLYTGIELIQTGHHFTFCVTYCYYQLGEIHVSIQENEKALEYFNKILDYITPDHDFLLFRVYSGMAGCYLSMKAYEKSKEQLLKALEIPNLSPPLLARGENDLGALLLDMNELDEAEKFLLSSLKVREELRQEDASCTSMVHLGEVYLAQGRIEEALALLLRCKAIAEKYEAKLKLLKILQLLANAYTAHQDYKTANDYFRQYNSLQTEVKAEQERNIFKLKNEQIEKQKKVITEKHHQLMETFEEIRRLKINRKAVFFSWITVIVLVLVSETFIDPLIENYAYNNLWSLAIKVFIALLFKPLDGMYEKMLMDKAMKKVN